MEGTREEILETAARLFSETEYEKVRLADVAKRSHVTRAPLYYYFESKEGLFTGVLERTLEEAYRRYSAIFGQKRPILETLREDYRCCMEVDGTWRRIWKQAEQMPECAPRVIRFYNWLLEQKQACFESARERGELQEDCDIREAITFIYIYYYGVLDTRVLAEKIQGLDRKILESSEDAFIALLKRRYIR